MTQWLSWLLTQKIKGQSKKEPGQLAEKEGDNKAKKELLTRHLKDKWNLSKNSTERRSMNPCKLTKKTNHTRQRVMTTIKNLVMTEKENRNIGMKKNQKTANKLQKCWNTNQNMTKTTEEGQGTEMIPNTGAGVAPTGEIHTTGIPTEAHPEIETITIKTEEEIQETDTLLIEKAKDLETQETEVHLKAEGLTLTGLTEDLTPITDQIGDQIHTTEMIEGQTVETGEMTQGQDMTLDQTVVQEMIEGQEMIGQTQVKDTTETTLEKTLTEKATTKTKKQTKTKQSLTKQLHSYEQIT